MPLFSLTLTGRRGSGFYHLWDTWLSDPCQSSLLATAGKGNSKQSCIQYWFCQYGRKLNYRTLLKILRRGQHTPTSRHLPSVVAEISRMDAWPKSQDKIDHLTSWLDTRQQGFSTSQSRIIRSPLTPFHFSSDNSIFWSLLFAHSLPFLYESWFNYKW